jgi:hypothetical protein
LGSPGISAAQRPSEHLAARRTPEARGRVQRLWATCENYRSCGSRSCTNIGMHMRLQGNHTCARSNVGLQNRCIILLSTTIMLLFIHQLHDISHIK